MTMIGTFGRTQPAARGCTDPAARGHAQQGLCKIDGYAKRRSCGRAQRRGERHAHHRQRRLSSDARTSSRTRRPTRRCSASRRPAGAAATGAPFNRAIDAAVAGRQRHRHRHRHGAHRRRADLGVPGEIYPQIALKVRDTVKGPAARLHDRRPGQRPARLPHRPVRGLPEPIRATFLDERHDSSRRRAPIGNDNYFFNVSHTHGRAGHLLAAARRRRASGADRAVRDSYDRCIAFPNDLVLPAGSDVTLSNAVP